MRALVTGAFGQDGSYLIDQLFATGHQVWGMTSRSNVTLDPRLLYGNLLDPDSLARALQISQPDVVFNVAAVTAPGGGWGAPLPPLLAEVTGVGVLRLIEAMVKYAPEARLINASSSAIYDLPRYGVYGIAKQFAYEAVVGYRKHLWCSNAVLFSHTSPRQDPRFLIRHICSTIRRIAEGEDLRLKLGDVDSDRDWGYAPDYCDAMRLIAKQDDPGDWVVSTTEQHTVREVVMTALGFVGLAWGDVVTIDSTLPPVPNEGPSHTSGRNHVLELGWEREHSFRETIEILMKDNDEW